MWWRGYGRCRCGGGFFCITWYGGLRDLHVLTHYFPTRRSSDLPGAGEPVQVRPEQPLAPAAAERHQRPPPAPHRQQPGQRTRQQGAAEGTAEPGAVEPQVDRPDVALLAEDPQEAGEADRAILAPHLAGVPAGTDRMSGG